MSSLVAFVWMCVAQGEKASLVEQLQLHQLQLQLASKEKELQVMKEGAQELKSLQQQNYLLQSKVPRPQL